MNLSRGVAAGPFILLHFTLLYFHLPLRKSLYILQSNLLVPMSYSTGFGALDSFLSPPPFEGGNLVSLTGEFSYTVGLRVLAKATRDGFPLVVDGSNTINPYSVVDVAKRMGMSQRILKKISVARGFTAHQLFEILNRKLSKEVEEGESSLILVTGPVERFLETGREEGMELLRECFESVSSLCRTRSIPAIALSTTPFKPNLNANPSTNSGSFKAGYPLLHNLEALDEVIHFKRLSEGIRVEWRGESLDFDPSINRRQTTLDEFVRELGSVPAPKLKSKLKSRSKSGSRPKPKPAVPGPQQRLTHFSGQREVSGAG